MMALSALAAALAEHIRERTGIAAFAARMNTAVYPMYTVSLLPGQITPMAGGRQLLRRLTARVACYPSRQREEDAGLDMADALLRALLPSLPLLGRHLAPMDCRFSETDNLLTLEFELEFCDLAAEDAAQPSPAEPMDTLVLQMDTKPKL